MIPDSLAPIANHLWQSTLFAGVAGLVTLVLRKNAARVRHWVWMAASVKFLVPFSLLIALGSHVHWRTMPGTTPTNFSIVMDQVSQPFTGPMALSPSFATTLATTSPLPLVLLTMWAIGLIGIACSWWVRWRRVSTAVRAGSSVELGLSIRAISSPSFLEPGVFGIFRPVLLLPEGIFEYLSPDQWKSVIAHELCHVRHRDNLIGAVQMFVETLFWFHPLVWWIGKRIFQEREISCDEEVLRMGSEPRTYAQGILKVCELYLESPVTCVAGVSGSNLRRRIEAIISHRIVDELTQRKKMLLYAVGMMVMAGPIAVGFLHPLHSAPQLEHLAFAAASIKPNNSVSPNSNIRPEPGRLVVSNMPVKTLISWAYNVRDFQISGGPGWIDSTRYDIEGKADGKPSQDQMRQMMKTLLSERFRLSLHMGKKELPIYKLTVAKDGFRLRPLKEGDCIVFDPANPPSSPKLTASDFCGNLTMGRGSFEGTSATMTDLALSLSQIVGRPVIDGTGIAGVFHIRLKFAALSGSAAEADNFSASADNLPSIFSAVL
jgi:bla regulator protein blaR1